MRDYDIQMMGLFPVPLFRTSIEREFSEEELNLLKNLEYRPNALNISSQDHYVLEHPEMVDIKKFITAAVNSYLDNIICPMYDLELYITQSWTNSTIKGKAHHQHRHPNSIVSGVLYLNAIEGVDRIIFHNRWRDMENLSIPTHRYNDFNTESVTIGVKTGDLIIFPSTLYHSVPPKEDDVERVSLAFNTFARGVIGDGNTLTELVVGQ